MQVFTGNGRVTQIQEDQKYVTSNGKSQFKFDVAIDSSYKDGDSGYLTTFFHVQTYGKQAEMCGAVLSVGSPVLIKGEIVDSPYVNEDGEKRTYRFLNADSNRGVTFLEGKETSQLRKKQHDIANQAQNRQPDPDPGFGNYTNE